MNGKQLTRRFQANWNIPAIVSFCLSFGHEKWVRGDSRIISDRLNWSSIREDYHSRCTFLLLANLSSHLRWNASVFSRHSDYDNHYFSHCVLPYRNLVDQLWRIFPRDLSLRNSSLFTSLLVAFSSVHLAESLANRFQLMGPMESALFGVTQPLVGVKMRRKMVCVLQHHNTLWNLVIRIFCSALGVVETTCTQVARNQLSFQLYTNNEQQPIKRTPIVLLSLQTSAKFLFLCLQTVQKIQYPPKKFMLAVYVSPIWDNALFVT